MSQTKHEPQRASADMLPPEPPAPAPTNIAFDERFPDPVIAEGFGSYPGGLRLLVVYDRSQEAEDPLVPELWLALPDGTKLRHAGIDGLSRALERLNYGPANADEAWSLVRLFLYPTSGSSSVIHRDPATKNSALPAAEIPPDVLAHAGATAGLPSTRETAPGTFEIELLEYATNSTPRFFGLPTERTLNRWTFRVGKRRFEATAQSLWSEGGPAARP